MLFSCRTIWYRGLRQATTLETEFHKVIVIVDDPPRIMCDGLFNTISIWMTKGRFTSGRYYDMNDGSWEPDTTLWRSGRRPKMIVEMWTSQRKLSKCLIYDNPPSTVHWKNSRNASATAGPLQDIRRLHTDPHWRLLENDMSRHAFWILTKTLTHHLHFLMFLYFYIFVNVV